jgi:anti-sigma regulatory factor (Ser/Thr protein kinase)
MKYLQNSNTIKFNLFFIGIILIMGLLFYSNSIVNSLRHYNKESVKVYSQIIAKTVNEPSDANLNFVFDEIIKKVQFPIIYSNAQNEPQYSRNLGKELNKVDLKKNMELMDKQNEPIPIIYFENRSNESFTLGYLHYGNSDLIRQLKWLPYLEIVIVSLFVGIGFVGFNSIRNSEKRNIWVGMARETAHQLGTPVSALMGWVDRLKSHPDESLIVLKEMELDLERLSQISDRFSKIGSKTTLKKISLNNLVNEQVKYIKKRVPAFANKLFLEMKVTEDIYVKGNITLLGWAIENIIKNGIDSIKNEEGRVEINILNKKEFGLIHIIDNGVGIEKKDWKNIFRPGFSTKNGGWGLGLSLVNRIIKEIHHGEIKVLRSEKDIGSTFEICLNKIG